MCLAAVQNVVPYTSNLIVGRGIPLAGIAPGSVNTNHVKCIVLPVRVVGMRRKCLFSREVTGPCIAVNVTNRNELVIQMTADRVGKVDDRDFAPSR